MPNVMWFRRDLRLIDNPAWTAATAMGGEVLPVFLVDDRLVGAAGEKRWAWFLANLHALDAALAELGGRLHVAGGTASDVLAELAGPEGTVQWNADYTPFATSRDGGVVASLGGRHGIHHGGVIHAPGVVAKDDGSPYKVFTPFWRRWRNASWSPWPEPSTGTIASNSGVGLPVPASSPTYEAGESAAMARLDSFLARLARYPEERDRPDLDTTSRLSADLKVGSLDARRVRAEVGEDTAAGEAFVRQLAWRDFHAGLLADDPECVDVAWNRRYRGVRWRTDPEGFEAWTTGVTGYPIVDAGMRELLATGFMHNRVRMIVASFLVKDLQIDWRLGERHFRRHLVDADVASNVGNWQWVTGTGADAAPYFRIFNPVTQAKRFDPEGRYVRRWVPELAAVPARWIQQPWEAPPLDLVAAGVTLGVEYPLPLVDHSEARAEALDRYKRGIG